MSINSIEEFEKAAELVAKYKAALARIEVARSDGGLKLTLAGIYMDQEYVDNVRGLVISRLEDEASDIRTELSGHGVYLPLVRQYFSVAIPPLSESKPQPNTPPDHPF
jgi:hypothetical protein